jgi:hypothetical protein
MSGRLPVENGKGLSAGQQNGGSKMSRMQNMQVN